jgi:hypothetical protein
MHFVNRIAAVFRINRVNLHSQNVADLTADAIGVLDGMATWLIETTSSISCDIPAP